MSGHEANSKGRSMSDNDNEEVWTFHPAVEGRFYRVDVYPDRYRNRPSAEFCRIFRVSMAQGRLGREGAELSYDGIPYRRAREQAEPDIQRKLKARGLT